MQIDRNKPNLQVPEEEGEDEPHSDPHDPSNNHEGQQAEVGKGLEKAKK